MLSIGGGLLLAQHGFNGVGKVFYEAIGLLEVGSGGGVQDGVGGKEGSECV